MIEKRCLVGVLLVVLLVAWGSEADLIISEMEHAASFQKSLTLRNTGIQSESLSRYAIHLYMNAANHVIYSLAPVSESENVAGGAQFTICHSRAPVTDICDFMWGGLNFNGNDAIELEHNGVVVDLIGTRDASGAESGGWMVDGVADATRYHRITRKADVMTGNTNWKESAASEWTVSSPSSPRAPPSAPTTPSAAPTTPSAAPIAESCWSLSGRLQSLSLDTCSRPISRRKRHITIGTLNTLFLFDGIDDRLRPWDSPAEATQHLQAVAALIRRNSPDILALQEVEDQAILNNLVREIDDPEYDVHFVQGRDTYTEQDVGMISQYSLRAEVSRTDCRASYPVSGSTCGSSDSGDTGVSKNMIVLFDSCLFGKPFAIINLHLLAIPTAPDRCSRREGQASVIQRVMNELLAADFEIILLGDINDFSDDIADIQGNKPTSKVLAMFRDPNNDGQDELQGTMGLLDQDERYSAWWDRDDDGVIDGVEELSVLDHILVTSGLARRIKRVWFDHGDDVTNTTDHYPYFVKFRRAEFSNFPLNLPNPIAHFLDQTEI